MEVTDDMVMNIWLAKNKNNYEYYTVDEKNKIPLTVDVFLKWMVEHKDVSFLFLSMGYNLYLKIRGTKMNVRICPPLAPIHTNFLIMMKTFII